MKFFSGISKHKKRNLLLIPLMIIISILLFMFLKVSIFGFSNPSMNLIYSGYKTMDNKHTSTRITGTVINTPLALQLIEDVNFKLNFYHKKANLHGDFNLSYEGHDFAETFFTMDDKTLEINLLNNSDTSYVMSFEEESNLFENFPIKDLDWMKYMTKSLSALNKIVTESDHGVRMDLSPEMTKPLLVNLTDVAKKDDDLKEAIFKNYNLSKNDINYEHNAFLEMNMDEGYPLYLEDLQNKFLQSIEDGIFENDEIYFNINKSRIHSIQFSINKNRVVVPILIEFLDEDYLLPEKEETILFTNLEEEEKKNIIENEVTNIIEEMCSLEALAIKIENSSLYTFYNRYKGVDNSEDFLLDILQMALNNGSTN